MVKRDDREKITVSLDELESTIPATLQAVHDGLYQRALENRENRTYTAANYDEFLQISNEKNGFIKAMWCGDVACEVKIKEDTTATSRCIPFDEEQIGDVCVCCGKPAKKMVFWGRQY